MCIGLPMQVTAVGPGHALCHGRGQTQRVETALVGEPAVGDWLLVFLGSAREQLSAERAAEVNATLDLLAAAMQAPPDDGTEAADLGFVLPSTLDAAALAAMTGSAPSTATTPTPTATPAPPATSHAVPTEP